MRLWVDFNEVEDHEIIEADLEFAQFFLVDEIRKGNRADLFDGAGHQCQATILGVDNQNALLTLKIDWSTWESPRRPRVFESRLPRLDADASLSPRTGTTGEAKQDWKWDFPLPAPA